MNQQMNRTYVSVAGELKKYIFQYTMSDRSFCYQLFEAFLVGGAAAVIVYATSYLIDKTIQHGDEIEELFSRLEECEENHESSQDS